MTGTNLSGRRLIAAAASRSDVAADLAAGGADMILAYHSSVYRERGLPSVAGLLPWASANEQTLQMLPQVVSGAGRIPVIATICANDHLRRPAAMLTAIGTAGAQGVLNAPTVGLLTGPVRRALEDSGLGQSSEIALIRQARDAGLAAWCYVFGTEWVTEAIAAGATGLVVHLGLTGAAGAGDRDALALQCLRTAAEQDSGIPVLLHGGPLRTPADLSGLLDRIGGAAAWPGTGFFGASAFESDPAGRTSSEAIRAWRSHLDSWEAAALMTAAHRLEGKGADRGE